ncbi:MAG TPA: ATP:cob(I)alamin adenosyltransferase, partial [Rhodopila sp.]|nr:ATP:cob(I)alamin adenosyltransferase [Rhodopila sp.]
MIRIDRVITKGGDKGETSLGDGSRVPKTDARIAAIGAVDEANAAIGVLRTQTRDRPEADAMLARIQNDLFDLGA